MRYVLFLFLSGVLYASTINVAVAANVSYAIKELQQTFHTLHPQINVRVMLGSSGKLTAQIEHGAPYDIFISADMKYPEYLYKKKIAITKPLIYAYGNVVLLSKKPRDFSKGVFILEDKGIKKIAIANPHTAPYGIASREILQNTKLYKKLKNKFIYGESISQTLSYTLSVADIGFVAKSALMSQKLRHYKKGINWIDIDTKLYTPTHQGMVILAYGKGKKEVQIFYDFLQTKKAKMILQKYGYHTL
ncbi:Molybdenum ABC transporter, periplasmic molybdenum-binding protein ModA (TC 3.A.1.8.1) [hydrothermal vent metagenome]|uniref:Molybdenum ABC transporter, periplasmic molybdenum-binding protein ModA (TC 3.A.1.8.1) n=1 Tax=hydrothermal vent metagenome TaxID=652676 RepID=A0A1W1D3R5_9ZZZZ